jgi:hypothetical protein
VLWILPYYVKTYQHDYYSTLLCFDSMLSYNTSVQNNIVMTTAKQNQKFPFHFCFRFAAEGWGEEAREKCKEIFWFLHTRVRERVRGALSRSTAQSERTRQFQATTRSARAISSFRQGSARNAIELCLIHTARNRNRILKPKWGRAEGATLMHSPRRIQNPKGFSTLRVARRLPIQFYE